jgi:hypothetical protein
MRLLRWTLSAIFFLAAILSAPSSLLADTNSASAVPGTLNYVEGNASIGSEALNSKSIGSAQLQPGQSLGTQTGKAEVLLTPGVFLRVGDDSSVKMISPSLTNTEVAIQKGEAIVEVDEIHPENDLRFTADGTTATLRKNGLYDFDVNQGELRVFDGEASLENEGKSVTVKGGHELALSANAPLKTRKFNKKDYEESDLYRWSSLRSAYMAEANVNAAGLYVDNGFGPWGPGWWGAGWYWDPWFAGFTFIPGDGIFYSPFGWGFYSPWWVYSAPYYGYLDRPGYYHHFTTDVRNWGPGGHYVEGPNYAHGIYRGPGSARGGGFHSGPMMAARGFAGFHGGRFGAARPGGGFSGGGFHGGGFHGGVGFSGGGGFHGR